MNESDKITEKVISLTEEMKAIQFNRFFSLKVREAAQEARVGLMKFSLIVEEAKMKKQIKED